MRAGFLTEKADSAAGRYRIFQYALEALFARAVIHPEFGSPAFARKVDLSAKGEAAIYLSHETRIIERELLAVAIEARRSLSARSSMSDEENFADAALTHLSASGQYLYDELSAQTLRDCSLLRREMQTLDLEVGARARTAGIPYRDALFAYHIQRPVNIEFQFKDRAGRLRAADGYVATAWRATALSVFNETVLQELSERGAARAAIVAKEGNTETVVDLVSVDGSPGAMSYGEALETYFHPNSDRYLTAEPIDV